MPSRPQQDFKRPAGLQRRNRYILTLFALFLLFVVIAATILTYRSALQSGRKIAAARLALQAESFASALDKYRLLAPLLARRPDILAAFSSAMDEEDLEAALSQMVRISGMSDAAEIQLTFLDGGRLSTLGNRQQTAPEAKEGALARPDVAQALQGQLGRHFLDDGQNRFFIFSSAARINAKVAGVVSIIVDLSASQQLWALAPQPIIAVQDDIIILSNRAGWLKQRLFRHGETGGPKGLVIEHSIFGPMLVHPTFTDHFRQAGLKYVAAEKRDYVLGWTFYAMEPLTRSIYAALLALLFASSISVLILGALWIFFSRQIQALRQRRKDMANSLWLERRIQIRTRELEKTQAGLIHSAKLAAIGQMSTVLSHEYNQPLMAIRSFSENASLLFQSGQESKGQENLTRIVSQVEKLSKLSKSLKSFARRPGVDICAVSVNAVVEESVMIMTPRARKCGVALRLVKPDGEVRVMAGHTRLEQVLVNLIANALDAFEEQNARSDMDSQSTRHMQGFVIELCYWSGEHEAVIQVRDNGPGIDRAIEQSIFEPFVTSKARGVGLGLGLPIAYNLIKGFGGHLRLAEPAGDGMATTFEISLPLAAQGMEIGAHSSEEVKPI
ncbi:ATP-binding protein [uncultured Cohaesibacter sp.]|uniref:sensor histidine kinase n=1 Tax=uncultured Cohaesibacter sp. TaxID=1002546 RepID=UPI0029C761C1|nr:ATP-binding protein [uncultured Cohaesibacter sp.]